MSRDDCIVIVKGCFKNLWNWIYYFIENFGIDPPTINRNQLPFH